MGENTRLSRRGFVKGATAAVAAAPWVIPSSALGLEGKESPGDRVALGCIGVGGRGTYNMRRLIDFGGQVVAVCDVKSNHRQRALEMAKLPDSAAYNDFRELLARKDVDAVMCATPDHWHVLIGIAAIKAGKDLYLEKPLGITVAEGRAMLEAVRQSDRIFMHGTEQRGQPAVRRVCELVRNGRIGRLHTIRVACPGGQKIGSPPEMPIPEGFDYDMWLGPAPSAPYTEKRCNPPSFFWISDYAPSGFISGWGIHHLDFAQWAMGTDDTLPIEIDGQADYPEAGDLADTALSWKIKYKYANGVKVVFTDGASVNFPHHNGVRFEGAEGWIEKSYVQPAKASDPAILESKIGPNEIHLYETDADDHCFLECVKSRRQTCSPIEIAHRSSAIGYLGDISCRLGRKLRFDPEKEHFIDDPEADKMLSREMRPPWHL